MQSGPDDLGTLVIPLAALLVGLMAFDLIVLARFAAKHPSTRLLFVSLYVLRPLVAFAFAVANPRADTGTFLLQVLASVFWVPYFLVSRRVRNTFCAAARAATTPVSPPTAVWEPEPVPAVLGQEPAADLALTVPYLKAWLIFCVVVYGVAAGLTTLSVAMLLGRTPRTAVVTEQLATVAFVDLLFLAKLASLAGVWSLRKRAAIASTVLTGIMLIASFAWAIAMQTLVGEELDLGSVGALLLEGVVFWAIIGSNWHKFR